MKGGSQCQVPQIPGYRLRRGRVRLQAVRRNPIPGECPEQLPVGQWWLCDYTHARHAVAVMMLRARAWTAESIPVRLDIGMAPAHITPQNSSGSPIPPEHRWHDSEVTNSRHHVQWVGSLRLWVVEWDAS